MWYNFIIDHGSALQDHQISELFSFCRKEEIWRQSSGSMRVTVINGNIACLLKEHMFDWTSKQAKGAGKNILPYQ